MIKEIAENASYGRKVPSMPEQQIYNKYVKILNATYAYCKGIQTVALGGDRQVQPYEASRGSNWFAEFQLSEERCRYAGPTPPTDVNKSAAKAQKFRNNALMFQKLKDDQNAERVARRERNRMAEIRRTNLLGLYNTPIAVNKNMITFPTREQELTGLFNKSGGGKKVTRKINNKKSNTRRKRRFRKNTKV